MAGIALARTFPVPWQILLLFGLAGAVGLIGWGGSRRTRILCACAITLALGGGRLLLSLPHFDADSLATYNEIGHVTLEGVIAEEPDEREFYTNLRVNADRLILADGRGLKVEGLALVKTNRYPPLAYGDRLQIEGVLETPPDYQGFSYRDYLARQGVHSLIREAQVTRIGSEEGSPLYAALLALKHRAQGVIAAILHEPAASLLTGILLGIETGIPADLMDDFSATGTTHIIAISGFNITIISGIFAALSRRLVGGRRATWVAIAGVLIYTLFVGASAAVVRAAIMGILYLLGKHLGRETFAPVSLAAAAVLMTALNPFTLWDVGFQLSLAATAGLILYVGPLERGAVRLLSRLTSRKQARQAVSWISEALLVTLAAQLTTTPVILYYFHRLSLVTLLTNFLILPVQSMVMICGGIATIAGLLWLPAGQVLGWVAWLPLIYTVGMVRLTARVPFAWVDLGRVSGWTLWAFYALLGALTWWGRQDAERRGELWGRVRGRWHSLTSRLSDRLALASSAVVLLLATIAWRSLPDGRLRVTFLDVDQGDAIFIRTPSGRQVLVDGGPSPSRLLDHLGRRMPFWDHSLDLVVLSHPDDNVLAGLIPVLERYRVRGVIARDLGCRTELCTRWEHVLNETDVPVWRGETGLQVRLDEGLLLTVLHPGPDLFSDTGADYNVNSMVLRLDHGEVCFLLTGDVSGEVESRLVENRAWLDCTVLKAAHHGDADSTTEPFLEAVAPEVVVISVGAENRFRLPHWETLKRLEARAEQPAPSLWRGRRSELAIYRTDRRGTVEVVSDGRTYWVRTEQ
jgi:competence protein ComEC